MSILPRDSDTIVAVSTPHGVGGISVLRISGDQSYAFICKLGNFLPAQPESHRIYYGHLVHPSTKDVIDEVLIAYFARGKSFTGEETVEISCHGNPLICEEIILALVSVGARPAGRGEFTYRAFLNDRLDLAQAEGVLSLIEAQSLSAKKLALRQLHGGFSTQVKRFEDQVTRLLAHVEADIDFSTENLETISREDAASQITSILDQLKPMISSYDLGKKIRDGIHLTFSGLPNVGKSTLFNLMLDEERAIVTNIAGTTRDVLEGEILYAHTRLVFSDTAGIRNETNDVIEKMGMEKSRKKREESDILVFVCVAGESLRVEEIEILENSDPERTMILLNKADQASKSEVDLRGEFLSELKRSGKFFTKLKDAEAFLLNKTLPISALKSSAREQILDQLLEQFQLKDLPQNEVIVIQARHYENLQAAKLHLETAKNLILQQESLEFIAFELKDSLLKIQEILGIHYDDQVLDRVFKEFCLGK